MVQGLRDLAALPDPVGDVLRGWKLPNGVSVRQVRVPFGVVGIIYEARPNVTADAAGIALVGQRVAAARLQQRDQLNRVTVRAFARRSRPWASTPMRSIWSRAVARSPR